MPAPRIRPSLLALVALLSVAGPAVAQAGAGPWTWLFDGKTTAKWRSFRGEGFPKTGWTVDAEGALFVDKSGGGDIVTVDEYGDFEMRFEWKIAPGANSGVVYRVDEKIEPTWASGPEYQVIDSKNYHEPLVPEQTAGGLYALAAPMEFVERPIGDWNEGRIVVRDGRLEHWLNGVRVAEAEWDDPAFRAKIAASKFGAMPHFAKAAKGRIALQDHGGGVWYRRIRIREFAAASERPLFNGKNLDGWDHLLVDNGKRDDVWSVTDEGVLVCKGRPVGYIRTKEDFKNFLLRVEWRFNPVTKQEGNSGVLLRMIGEDKVWPRSIEAQLQSKNAGDFWNIEQFPMRVDSRRTNGRNTKKLAMAENPVGEWNAYEIECTGGYVELRVNGRVVNDAYECFETAGKICLQSEGAEIHFRKVALTPVGDAGPACPSLADFAPSATALPRLTAFVSKTEAPTSFSVDVTGVEEIWLLADPTADGNGHDWADWCQLTLESAGNDDVPLVDLPFIAAVSGWGKVERNKNCDGGPLQCGGRKVLHGIGTHAASSIGIRLDKKYTRLIGACGIDDAARAQPNATPSVLFSILAGEPGKASWYR